MADKKAENMFEVPQDIDFEGRKDLPVVDPAIYVINLVSVEEGERIQNMNKEDEKRTPTLDFIFGIRGIVKAHNPEVVNADYIKANPRASMRLNEPESKEQFKTRFTIAGQALRYASKNPAAVEEKLKALKPKNWVDFINSIKEIAAEVVKENQQYKGKWVGSVYQNNPRSAVPNYPGNFASMNDGLRFQTNELQSNNDYYAALTGGTSGGSGGGGSTPSGTSGLPF